MTIEITGAPDFDGVITVAQLKEHLRVDSSDEDTLIEAYRDAAIAWVEDYCNTRLGDVAAVGYMDYFYNARFPIGPVQSITSVTYLDTANASQTLATTKYWFDIKTKATRITFDSVPDLYDDTFNAVQDQYGGGLSRGSNTKSNHNGDPFNGRTPLRKPAGGYKRRRRSA